MECSEPLQNKIKNSTKLENISATQNCIDLAELIKVLVFKYEEDQYLPLSIFNAKSAFYMFSQGSMQLNDYREKYSNLIQVLVSYNIQIYERQTLKERCEDQYANAMWHGLIDQFAKDNPKEFKEIENALHEEMSALAFLANSNKQKYGHIIAELHDDYLKGNNHYPKNMNDMYKLLDEHSNDKNAIDPNAAGPPHLVFVQGSKGI